LTPSKLHQGGEGLDAAHGWMRPPGRLFQSKGRQDYRAAQRMGRLNPGALMVKGQKGARERELTD
jgi:hypothetical protein